MQDLIKVASKDLMGEICFACHKVDDNGSLRTHPSGCEPLGIGALEHLMQFGVSSVGSATADLAPTVALPHSCLVPE